LDPLVLRDLAMETSNKERQDCSPGSSVVFSDVLMFRSHTNDEVAEDGALGNNP
jgi:hypothetical protein